MCPSPEGSRFCTHAHNCHIQMYTQWSPWHIQALITFTWWSPLHMQPVTIFTNTHHGHLQTYIITSTHPKIDHLYTGISFAHTHRCKHIDTHLDICTYTDTHTATHNQTEKLKQHNQTKRFTQHLTQQISRQKKWSTTSADDTHSLMRQKKCNWHSWPWPCSWRQTGSWWLCASDLVPGGKRKKREVW